MATPMRVCPSAGPHFLSTQSARVNSCKVPSSTRAGDS
jgi:hypothetical protein